MTVPVSYFKDSTVFQWENLTLRSDLILTLPIAICLGVGIAVGHPAAGLLAAGGAANTGFGQKHSIDESHLLPMIFVTFGMAFAGFAGVVLGHENLLLVVAAALWAFGYGMLTARPDGYSWVGQQCVITFLVASAYPAPLRAAVAQGLLLFAGGAVQLLVSSALLHLFGDLRARLFQLTRYLREEQSALRSALIETAESVRQLRFAESALPYALRLAFTVGLATEIYRRLHYQSGYWIPMTALLVQKPAFYETLSRALARVAGTLAGATLATVLASHLHPGLWPLAALTTFFAFWCFATNGVNYGLFSLCITSYIVFLLSLNQIPGPELAHRRAACTAVGAVIAVLIHLDALRRNAKAPTQT